MNKAILTAVLACAVASSDAALAGRRLSYGIGGGAIYSGLGVNIGAKGDGTRRYVALGCPAVGYSSADGWVSACGIGAGWIWSHIVPESGGRHSFGIHLGAVGATDENSDHHYKTAYGIGLPYVYFPGGLETGGLNFGVMPAIGRTRGTTKGFVMLQIGYQF